MKNMMKIARIALLGILLLAVSFGSYTNASAAKPYCNNVVQPLTIFEGNIFSVSWTGSPNIWRAFVVWPLDDRAHWAAYELTITDESFGGTTSHAGFAPLDLSVDTWTHGQLIVVLTTNSAQEGHRPAQVEWTHGQLIEILRLNPLEEGQKQPDGPPLCKTYLAPLAIRARP